MRHDEQQQKIIELRDTTALVLAGPGCGKTHILARRVFHASSTIDYDKMLCVTFTNRAAREMKQRIEGYTGHIPDKLFVGNMHRFCLRFLYENNILGAANSVLDEEDRFEYLSSTFGYTRQADVTEFLTKAAYVYQQEHDHPDWIIRHPTQPISDFDLEAIDTYTKFKTRNRLLDFDDILLHTYTALQEKKAKDYCMTDYRWVQVDEVQDMTPLQLAIVDAVTVRHRRTMVYFGDEQQAIFRFIGAGGRALEVLKRQCAGNILHLKRNYRSPGYLVEMCNTLATDWLGLDKAFLPEAVDINSEEGNMTLHCGDYEEIAYTASNICRHWMAEHRDESIALLCRTNKDAEYMSALLKELGLSHFHVSKQDLFHQIPFKTVWAHLAATAHPAIVQPWIRLLYQTKCVSTLSGARNLTRILRDSAIGCDELLSFDKPVRVERLVELYKSDTEIVVFDTETTGLDILNDDIIQIAAIKLVNGEIVGRFEAFITTKRRIPRELSPGQANPLAEIYEYIDKKTPDEAFESFIRFIGNAIPAGHNLAFDIPILRANILRRTSIDIPWRLKPDAETLDTLILSRQLFPQLKNHRLGTIIAALGLEGKNSHNAYDDTEATAILLKALVENAGIIMPKTKLAVRNDKIKRCAEKFKAVYGKFYKEWFLRMHETDTNHGETLCKSIKAADEFLSGNGFTTGIPSLEYVLTLIDRCVCDSRDDAMSGRQISRHLFELLSFNESDLFANGIIDEQLSVMTVHKAKGLEMDNVVIFDATKQYGTDDDHARLLYVAFSRARKRLAVGISGNMPLPMRGLHHYFRQLTPNQIRLAVNCEYLNRK